MLCLVQFLVEIQVHGKNDEMWIGLTRRDPDSEYISVLMYGLSDTSDAWSYYGGRERSRLEYADRTKPTGSGHESSAATAVPIPAQNAPPSNSAFSAPPSVPALRAVSNPGSSSSDGDESAEDDTNSSEDGGDDDGDDSAESSESDEDAHLNLADGPFGAPHPLIEDVLNLYGPRVLTHPLRKSPYSAGDKVGLLIDLSRGTMAAYLNDSFQFETAGIPVDRPLYLFAVVDGPGDRLELLPLRVPAPS